MAVARVKVWVAGEILYASDLNIEFNNILNNALSLISPLTTSLNAGGFKITNYGGTDAPTSVTDVALNAFVQSGTGAATRTLQAKLRDIISVKDYGAVGDGVTDDTTAIQAALNLAAAGTNTLGNPAIYIPCGTYLVSTTLAPTNSASNFVIYGDGKDATVIKWNGAAASPVFKYTNARAIFMRDLSVYGKSTAKPSALVQYHRAAGGTIGSSTGFCGLIRVRLGDGNGDHTKGVLTSADGGQDTNNEEHIFEDVDVIGSATYGYHFSHSNSLLHNIVRGNVQSYGTAAISNDCAGANNASFRVYQTTFAGANDSVMFEVSNPRVDVEIFGAFHENAGTTNTKILSCPTAFVSGGIKFFGGRFTMADPTSTSTVVWNGDSSSLLEFHGITVSTGTGATYNFTGAGRVTFFGGDGNTATMTYNGDTTMDNWKEGSGSPTYTQAGSGTLRLIRSSGSSQLAVADIVTSGATPSIAGLKVDGLVVFQYVGATNVTKLLNGYAGQIVTVLANNGNATLVHNTGTDNFFVKGLANVTLAGGQCITFRKLGTAIGVDVWLEIGRNF